jgi:hypothetical protein
VEPSIDWLIVETQTKPRLNEPAFHADDVDQTVAYRTFSVLAIIALLLGLASPLCFVGGLLFGIPLIGIAVSVLAIRRIDTSDGVLAGRWAAVIGLALCVASLASALTRDTVGGHLRASHAEAFARDWLSLLVAGRPEDAFRLTVEGAQPRPQMPEPGVPAPDKSPYELFLERPVIRAIQAAGAGAAIRLDETVSSRRLNSFHVIVEQKFSIVPATSGDSTGSPVEVVLTVQRARLASEGGSRWLVSSYAPPSPSPQSPTR